MEIPNEYKTNKPEPKKTAPAPAPAPGGISGDTSPAAADGWVKLLLFGGIIFRIIADFFPGFDSVDTLGSVMEVIGAIMLAYNYFGKISLQNSIIIQNQQKLAEMLKK